MVPPAPGRFSTMIGWPSCLASRSRTVRATMSVAAPAANGTTALMGLAGHGAVCEMAASGNIAIANTRENLSNLLIRVSDVVGKGTFLGDQFLFQANGHRPARGPFDFMRIGAVRPVQGL